MQSGEEECVNCTEKAAKHQAVANLTGKVQAVFNHNVVWGISNVDIVVPQP